MRDEYDFTGSKRGAVAKTAKERITIRLDPDIIEWFRSRVKGGGNYQTLINEALREHIGRQSDHLSVAEFVRKAGKDSQ